MNRITNERCDEMYGNGTIMPSMLCAHDEAGEHDACQGDSGGPLVTSGYLIGVISTGEGCASKEYPGIYASVPYLYDWITETVRLTSYPETTSESTPDFTDEDITEPSKQPEIPSTKTPEVSSQSPSTSHHAANSTTKHSHKHQITTGKNLDDNSTVPVHNETKHIGDHSRKPEEIDTTGAGVKISATTMTILLVLIQLYL